MKGTPVFIDVDGVLAATVEQLMLDHNRDDFPKEYRIHSAWKMPHEQVWGHTDTIGWWANLPVYDHAKWLVDYFSDPVLLTSPMGPNSYAGKAIWAKRHFPDTPLIIANDKHLIARQSVSLLDDCEANIEAWDRAGGRGVLWPRLWNSGGSNPFAAIDGSDFSIDSLYFWCRSVWPEEGRR